MTERLASSLKWTNAAGTNIYTEATFVGENESGGDIGPLASNGDGYAATWLEVDPADGNVHVHFPSYDGAQWSTRAIEDQAGRAAWSVIAEASEGYTVL